MSTDPVSYILEQPAIFHDGSLDSCHQIKKWARQRGIDLLSCRMQRGDVGFRVRLGRPGNVIELCKGDTAWFTSHGLFAMAEHLIH